MRDFRFHSFYAIALMVALAACSSDGGGSSSGGNDAGSNDGGAASASAYAASYCDLLQPCCVAAGFEGDMAWCKLATAGQAGYDAAAGERCLSTMRERAKDATLCSNVPPCHDVFRGGGGSGKPGDACSQDTDCAAVEGAVVRCQKSGSESYCQVQRPGTEGDAPCVASVVGPILSLVPGKTADGYVCADTDGLTCDWSSKECRRLGGDGESCESITCADDLWCDPSQVCRPRATAGASCTSGFDVSCQRGHKCEGGVCVAQAKNGEACSVGSDCASGNCAEGECQPAFDLGYAMLCGGT